MLQMFFVVLWVGNRMERASDDGLRFALFRNDHAFKSVLAGTYPTISSDKVGVASPLHKQLGGDRVVVIVDRDMAIGAGFSLGRSR